MSFAEVLVCAPRDPGVYMAREGRGGPIVYVGHAGERRGQGIRGRLKFYASGKGLTSDGWKKHPSLYLADIAESSADVTAIFDAVAALTDAS